MDKSHNKNELAGKKKLSVVPSALINMSPSVLFTIRNSLQFCVSGEPMAAYVPDMLAAAIDRIESNLATAIMSP